jgi:transposase-like protein
MGSFVPPFCPNPSCHFHRHDRELWRFVHHGFFSRQATPQRIQRYQCRHCRRHFSSQTFACTYWLKRPDLLHSVFNQLVGCMGYRQIARQYRVSPQTILAHAARLGRHCLLFHERLRPCGIPETVALDGFQSFEWSQYHPTWFNVLAGASSHFFYGFTDTELRRSGSMTPRQKEKRRRLELRYGRPDPRGIERDSAELLRIAAPHHQSLELHTDEQSDYPRALRGLPHLQVNHHTISSRAARTPRNPLFPINLLDLLIRHSSANHKRETIAFSKRRQSAAERLWVLLVWRNYIKCFSERKRDATPAMRLGITDHKLQEREVLAQRIFPSHVTLPDRWARYYWREVNTRMISRCCMHRRVFAA